MGDASLWPPLAVLLVAGTLGLLASLRRVPPGRRAVVTRFGRPRCLGPALVVIVPDVDQVTWLDVAEGTERLVLPFRLTADGVTVGLTADVTLAVEDPMLAVIEAGDPRLAALEVVEHVMSMLAGDHTLADVVELIGTPLPGVCAAADRVTRDFGVRVVRVGLVSVELPRPAEILRWAGASQPGTQSQ